MAVLSKGSASRDELFEVFEGSEVDGAVGEHPDQTHGKATVKGTNACGFPHLASGGEDEGIAVKAAFHGFVLDTAGRRSARAMLVGLQVITYNFKVSRG